MFRRDFAVEPWRYAMQVALAIVLAAAPSTGLFAAEGRSKALEEVVVTATRREESQQDVPIPMTAVSGEALERAFAQDLRDLTQASPNVALEPVGIFQNAAAFVIRGQGTADIESASDSKVAILVDGVVQGRVSTALSDLVDVRSVEILRGPQGTLFGRNTIAGAVQIHHNAPEHNEMIYGGSAQIGDFGRRDLKGVLNLPILEDRLTARIAAKSTEHDGYWENEWLGGRDRGATDRLTVLPSLRFTPNERLDMVFRGEWSKTRDDTYLTSSHHYCRDDPATLFTGGGSGPGGAPDNDLVITTQTLYNLVVLGQDPFTAAGNAASLCGVPIEDQNSDDEYSVVNTEDRGQGAEVDVWGITAEFNYDLKDLGTLTYIGNYREVDEDIIFTIDVAPHDLFAGRRVQEHDQFSHELRFASNFSDRYDFVVGGYYFEQEYTMLQESFGILFAPNILLTTPDPGGAPTLSFTDPTTQGQAGWSNQVNDAWAVFGQGNWHLTPKLTLTAGGRYTVESKDFSHCGVGAGDPLASFGSGTQGCNDVSLYTVDFTTVLPGVLTPLYGLNPAIGFDASGGAEGGCVPVLDPSGGPITCNNRLRGDESWEEFTPMAGVSYQLSDDILLFATYARGFKSGGFNGRATTPTTIGPYDPETADNYEVGIKSEWFDSRLRVNLNAFYAEIQDFQQAFIRPSQGAGGQETVQANLGEVQNEGFELEMQWLPTPSLNLWGNLSFLDIKQKGFCTDGDGFSGSDPDNPPPPGPFSSELPQCAPAERITNEIGQFLGWLVPTDNSNLLPGPRAPEWTAALGFSYEFDLQSLGRLSVSADWQYTSEQLVAASRATELDGVRQFNGDLLSHFRKTADIYNASIVWRDRSEKWRISAFGKNLTDEMYNQATTNVGGLLNFRVPNIRRHYGVELAYQM